MLRIYTAIVRAQAPHDGFNQTLPSAGISGTGRQRKGVVPSRIRMNECLTRFGQCLLKPQTSRLSACGFLLMRGRVFSSLLHHHDRDRCLLLRHLSLLRNHRVSLRRTVECSGVSPACCAADTSFVVIAPRFTCSQQCMRASYSSPMLNCWVVYRNGCSSHGIRGEVHVLEL